MRLYNSRRKPSERTSWRRPLIGFLASAIVVWLCLPRAALACGTWRLTDHESSVAVHYEASRVRTKAENRGFRRAMVIEWKEGQGYVARLGGPDNLRLVAGDISLGKRLLGSLKGDVLSLGERTYRISIATKGDLKSERPHAVRVFDANHVVASGDALSFAWVCSGDNSRAPSHKSSEMDVRVRVAFYLAWRDMIAPSALRRSPAGREN